GQFSGVGAYAINQGSLANANYSITYTGADSSITPKAITVAADAQSKVYGDLNPSSTYVATGLVNNDTSSGALSTSAGQFSGVGTYAINQGSLANANYTITYTGADSSITPKTITVAANAQSKVYGDVNPSSTYMASTARAADHAGKPDMIQDIGLSRRAISLGGTCSASVPSTGMAAS
ncbi:hypothetical protein OY671_009867, partial [Metschnikowia pulcherrima]